MVANSILEVGACYRHKAVGTLMEVRGISDIGYTNAYDCYVIDEIKMMQLPFGREDEWDKRQPEIGGYDPELDEG